MRIRQHRNKTPPPSIHCAEDNFDLSYQTGDTTMFNKAKIALAAVLIVGAASAAFAGNDIDESPSTAQSIRESREANQLPWWWNTPSTGRPGDAYGLASEIQKPGSPHPKTHRNY
jgi:hypothetical protein